MPKKKNPHASISSTEAGRAIYIDFEGFQDKSPSLIGVLIEDKFEQIVLEPELGSAASAKSMRLANLDDEVLRLIDLSRQEDRYIVAYSQHELNVIKEYADRDISDIYRDARMIAKKWKVKFHRESAAKCKALKDYLSFIEYPRGAYLGEKKSTSRIKAVQEMIRTRGEYEKLTPVAKAKWTKLLEHNEIDCKGMKALVLRAAQELE